MPTNSPSTSWMDVYAAVAALGRANTKQVSKKAGWSEPTTRRALVALRSIGALRTTRGKCVEYEVAGPLPRRLDVHNPRPERTIFERYEATRQRDLGVLNALSVLGDRATEAQVVELVGTHNKGAMRSLRRLVAMGLVKRERDGRRYVYTVTPSRFGSLQRYCALCTLRYGWQTSLEVSAAARGTSADTVRLILREAQALGRVEADESQNPILWRLR